MDERRRFAMKVLDTYYPESAIPDSIRSGLPHDWKSKLVDLMVEFISYLETLPRFECADDIRRFLQEHRGLFGKAILKYLREVGLALGLGRSTLDLAFEHMLVADHCSDGFFVKDLSNKYALVNTALAEMLGKPQSEIIGHSDSDIYSSKHAEMLEKAFEAAKNGDLVRHHRTLSVREEEIELLEMFVAKLSPEGMPVGVYGVVRKISPAKRSEALEPREGHGFPSLAMRKTLEECLLAARNNAIVLLTGESGSGKDWLARYIHEQSPRCSRPYFSINCAAIPAEMAESELFGHEKGAFTGAHDRKRGLLELAEGGTLLLDEIGELPLAQQAKLLTFLDTRSFTRVGGEKKIKVDARLIAATNRDLAAKANNGEFRQDLFYRLNVFQIEVPPVRERIEDIPILVRKLLAQLAQEMNRPSPPVIADDAMAKLQRYSWPGNVRELRNLLERAVIISPDTVITADPIGFASEAAASPISEPPIQPLLKPLSHLENDLKKMYEEVCVRFDEKAGTELGEPGSATAIATILGCRRETVRRRLRRLGCPKVVRSGLSEDAMADLIRRLEDWLTRHGFDLGRAPR